MKRYLILALIMGLFMSVASAQNGQRRQELQKLRKQFIEEKLGLSATNADKFWVVYSKYEAERKGLRKEMKQLKAGFNALSDAELETAIQRYFQLKEEELEVDKKHFKELKKVLTIRQIAVLYQAENKFKQEVLKRFRERMKNGRNDLGNE